MGQLTNKLPEALQAHENWHSRLQAAERDYRANQAHINPEIRSMSILMACVFPDAGGKLKNGSTVMTVGSVDPTPAHVEIAGRALIQQKQIFETTPLTFVNEEVMDLLGIATAKMDTDVIHPTDLIAPSGFVYLSKPIYQPDFHPDTGEYDPRLQFAVRGIAWHEAEIQLSNDSADLMRGVVLTLYSDYEITRLIVDPGLREVWEAEKSTPYTPIVTHGPGYCLYTGDQHAWAYGVPWTTNPDMTATRGFDSDRGTVAPLAVANIRKWFLAFMRFCWQELIVPRKPNNMEVSRQVRRAFERSSKADNPISVVYLRRLREDHDEPQTLGHSLTYRVLVRGHWRNQYYPTLGPVDDPMSHRRIWIDPHVKGPEHAPFREGLKVTAVVR